MSAQDLAYAHGGAPLSGILRAQPEDFQVIEQLGYTADGEGEHVLLTVRKRGLTTQQAAEALARHAGVKSLAVGFAGMKDRHAVTEQAFSVQLPGREEPNWQALTSDELQVLDYAPHRRKLKRGALKGNRFVIVLRDVAGDRRQAETVLEAIRTGGVPNFFGEQRFGRYRDNVEQARAMFAGRRVKRNIRGILLSAARSQIFNVVLDIRVREQSWNHAIDGEIYCLAGSRSWFGPEDLDETLAARLEQGDIHPSGPMWGQGDLPTRGRAAELEQSVADSHPALVAGLVDARMDQDRRALRLLPKDMEWRWLADETLELRFDLPAGAYATTVLREVANTNSSD